MDTYVCGSSGFPIYQAWLEESACRYRIRSPGFRDVRPVQQPDQGRGGQSKAMQRRVHAGQRDMAP